MKKFGKLGTTLVAATFACSLAPTPALALAGTTARASVRAGLGQVLGAILEKSVDAIRSRQTGDATLDITEAGTYVLTGSMRGTVRVDPGVGDVRLVMDNVAIDGDTGPAIDVVSGDSLTISLPAGSRSRVSNEGAGPFGRATIESGVDTFIEGEGFLAVIGDEQPGVRVDDADLTFRDGRFEIVTGGDGVAVEGLRPGRLAFEGGSFDFRVGGEPVAPGIDFKQGDATFNDLGFGPDDRFDAAVERNMWTNAPQVPAQQAGAPQDGGQAPANGQLPSDNSQQLPSTDGQQPGQVPGGKGQLPTDGNGRQQPGQAPTTGQLPTDGNQQQSGQMPSGNAQQQPGQFPSGGQFPTNGNLTPGQQTATGTVSTAGTIATGTTTNGAAALRADLENATTYDVSETSQIKIGESGTYIVTGTSTDGNITVKKGTTGVVLILKDLDLASTTGATLSVNKEAEVQVVISGTVTLTDNENPDDENSADADVADAYDGAAIKVKAGAQVYLIGDGSLVIKGNAKNGIKAGDDSSLVIDGDDLEIDIAASNDGINGNYDVTILSGNLTIAAGDDAIHADRILTIGDETTHTGPTIKVTKSYEGLEGTVVNICGGDVSIKSSDDAINAANGDGTYEGELDYSINMTGGSVTIDSSGDGLDSNGNINLVGGSASIKSASNGGEAGIDYDGELYVSDEFGLNNQSGVAGPDMMPGQMGGQPGDMGGMPGQMGGQQGQPSSGSIGGQQGQPGQTGFGQMGGQFAQR